MVFLQFSAFGAKPGRNPFLVMALWKIDFRNTIGRAFHGGLPIKNKTKTQNLTHFWPEARISFFSEWTVGRYLALVLICLIQILSTIIAIVGVLLL